MKTFYLICLFLLLNSILFSQQYVAYYSATVKDSADHPILFALITAEGADSTYNDPTGRFLLQFFSLNFPPGQSVAYPTISIYNPKYEEYHQTIMLSEGDSIIGPDIILTPKVTGMFTISGHIKYDNNNTVLNAHIYFFEINNSNWYYTSTNSEGNYSIKINPGSYYVYAWIEYHIANARTFRLKYYNNKSTLQEADLLLVNDNMDEVNFTFPALQQGSISGKVRDAATQQSLSNAWVMVSSAEPGDSSFTSTDQNGNYSIQVFEGDYILYAHKIGYYLQFYQNAFNPFDALPVSVSNENLHVTEIDFDLTKPEPGTNIIRGFVRDESTLPLPNVQIYAIPLSGGSWIETKSNYEGQYVLRDIINDRYILLFYKEGYISEYYKDVYEWEEAFIFNLKGNENIIADDVFLKPMNPFGGEISGQITSNSGSSVSGTLISAVNSSGLLTSSSLSVYNGSYIIPSLGNGNYTIKASKIGYTTSEYSNKIQIDFSTQPVVSGVDFAIIATGVEEDENTIPEFFKLFQNYPNPFNPSTTIKYELPKESEVQLIIYNMLGEKVAELVNTFKKPGRYAVEWNAQNFSSGVYFYQIRTENFISTKKIILLR